MYLELVFAKFLVSAKASSLLPTIIVSTLFSANLIAVALPIPLPPPVIKHNLSFVYSP